MTIHNAPSVVYPVGRSHFQAGALLGLWTGGAALVALWLGATAQSGWRTLLGLLALALAGGAAIRAWRAAPSGELTWDGLCWHWSSIGGAPPLADCALSVIADFQQLMVLRIASPAGALLWLTPVRGDFPERWLDLRRAVHGGARGAGADWAVNPSEPPAEPAVAVSEPMASPVLLPPQR